MGIVELRQYIAPARKWWWLILLTTGVAAVSSFMYLQAQTPVYKAQTTIMIGAGVQNLNPNNAQFGLAEQLTQVYADIANRAPVRYATMEALDLNVLPPYTVKPVLDSPLLEISVTDEDPVIAQAVAREIVEQLILQSPAGQEENVRQQFIVEQLAKLEGGIQETEDEIALKQTELTTLFSAREIATTQDQILALQNKLSSMRSNYSSLLANSHQNAINRITILEPAGLPQVPVNNNQLLSLLMATMVGFVLGTAAAYLLEFTDTSIRNGYEVRKQFGIPLLASVPVFRGQDALIMLNETVPAVAEAYRGLRINLQYAGLSQPTGTLVLTGPAPHDGKSMTTANICITLARAGKRVILVDADLHRPRQHWLFQVPNTVGLATLLMNEELELEKGLQKTRVPNLLLLPSGQLPEHPSELLDSPRMQELLHRMKEQADYVILDTPPLSAVVDAAVLSTQADGVLFVLRADKTTWELAGRTLDTLRQVGAPIVGAILNGVAVQYSTYSDAAYGYGFHAAAEKPERKRSGLSLWGKRPAPVNQSNYTLNGHAKEPAKDNHMP